MLTYFSNSWAQTEAIASEFARTLKLGDVIAYCGGLGAGKTAFTRGLATGLQVHGEVSSPTFALVHEYKGSPSLYHFDMYRIQTLEDVHSTGYFDYLDLNEIMAVEWSENVPELFDERTIYVELLVTGEDTRTINIFTKKGGQRL